jgi:hypothetical protein
VYGLNLAARFDIAYSHAHLHSEDGRLFGGQPQLSTTAGHQGATVFAYGQVVRRLFLEGCHLLAPSAV